MPRTYTRRFRVRSTDCDASRTVHHAVYLRYLQETAIEASADAGYDAARYAELNANWVIRRSRIDYLQPLRYGDEIDVTTYVANFRRVRSQRHYLIDRRRDGGRVTQAMTDWVFIDRDSGAPRRAPEEMSAAFLPEGPTPGVDVDLEAVRLPDAPPPHARHTSRRVAYADMDENQHVNNAVYLNYLEQASIDATASLGFDVPHLLALGGFFTVRQHDIEYLRPAQYGDTLDVATWVGEVTPGSVLRYCTLHLQGGPLTLRVQTRWVWIDRQGKSAEMPAELLKAFTADRQRMDNT